MENTNNKIKLFDALRRFEESRNHHYSSDKMKKWLGDEPWDTDLVLNLYMKNHRSMDKILTNHKGYIAYYNFSAFKKLLLRLNLFAEYITTEIHKCEYAYFQENKHDILKTDEILFSHQNTINLYFYGYTSLYYSIFEYQKKIENTESRYKYLFKQIFDNSIKLPCHRGLNLVRVAVTHLGLLEFKWLCRMHQKNIHFKITQDDILAIDRDSARDREGKKYLIDISGDLLTILNESQTMMHVFCTSICNTIFETNKYDIIQCNEYYKKIICQMENQARAIASQIRKYTPPIQKQNNNPTYYIDRAMRHKF